MQTDKPTLENPFISGPVTFIPNEQEIEPIPLQIIPQKSWFQSTREFIWLFLTNW
jgi:hypothetical protein